MRPEDWSIRQLKEIQARETVKAQARYEENLPKARARIEEELSSLENFPLTETQQRLVNYLRANTDDVAEAIGLFE